MFRLRAEPTRPTVSTSGARSARGYARWTRGGGRSHPGDAAPWAAGDSAGAAGAAPPRRRIVSRAAGALPVRVCIRHGAEHVRELSATARGSFTRVAGRSTPAGSGSLPGLRSGSRRPAVLSGGGRRTMGERSRRSLPGPDGHGRRSKRTRHPRFLCGAPGRSHRVQPVKRHVRRFVEQDLFEKPIAAGNAIRLALCSVLSTLRQPASCTDPEHPQTRTPRTPAAPPPPGRSAPPATQSARGELATRAHEGSVVSGSGAPCRDATRRKLILFSPECGYRAALALSSGVSQT